MNQRPIAGSLRPPPRERFLFSIEDWSVALSAYAPYVTLKTTCLQPRAGRALEFRIHFNHGAFDTESFVAKGGSGGGLNLRGSSEADGSTSFPMALLTPTLQALGAGKLRFLHISAPPLYQGRTDITWVGLTTEAPA